MEEANTSYEEVNPAANASVSSSSSNEGSGFVTSKKFKIGKHRAGKTKDANQTKMKKKNKITKDDFFSKTAEFRMWLSEQKGIAFDNLGTPKAKELFKKFVKSWNGKKLNEKYYGLSAYWAATSPAAYSHMAMPVITEEESRRKLKASSYTPLYDQDFSTFGKRAGKRALRQLQDMQESMPSGGDNVYDAPTPVDKSKLSLDWKQADRAEDGYEEVCRPKNNKPIRPRPLLSQMFDIGSEMTKALPLQDHAPQPVFAQVKRQRPLSCHGRLQKSKSKRECPVAPVLPSRREDTMEEEPHNMTISQKKQRPKSEHVSILRSRNRQRSKPAPPQRTTSICSTTSRGSHRSHSGSSIASSVSSTLSQHCSEDAEYVTFEASIGPNDTSKEAEYVTFERRPPTMHQPADANSQVLRQVAQVVLAKQAKMAASPAYTRKTPASARTTSSIHSGNRGEKKCQTDPGSPALPPPPFVSSPREHDMDTPLPPPPSPQQLSLGKCSSNIPKRPPLPPQNLVSNVNPSKMTSYPKSQPPPKTPSSKPLVPVLNLRTPCAPQFSTPGQERVPTYNAQTPRPVPATGLSLNEVIAARVNLVTPSVKLRKRPSSECLENLASPSKKGIMSPKEGVVDLNRSNMSCRSTSV